MHDADVPRCPLLTDTIEKVADIPLDRKKWRISKLEKPVLESKFPVGA
jgi:hypothetical protein